MVEWAPNHLKDPVISQTPNLNSHWFKFSHSPSAQFALQIELLTFIGLANLLATTGALKERFGVGKNIVQLSNKY